MPAPAVADGRVFVADFERVKQSGRLGGNERLLALDEVTGEELWSRRLGRQLLITDGVLRDRARTTPMVDGDRVYVVGAAW